MSRKKEPTVSCRTPQVMKLLEKGKNSQNEVILAGKSRIPQKLRRREPLSKIMRRGLGESFGNEQDTVVVNITELAIGKEAPEVLDRFNACSCQKCVEAFSMIIAEKVPARFARVGEGALSERVEPMRRVVMNEMIRELICTGKRCYHDDNDDK